MREPQPKTMRAVIYSDDGRHELHIADLTELVRIAIEKGLVKVK